MNILDGKKLSQYVPSKIRIILDNLKQEILRIKNTNALFCPSLYIIQIGNDNGSNSYINLKCKSAASVFYFYKVGIKHELLKLNSNIKFNDLKHIIETLNTDTNVTGYIIQQPLPEHLNVDLINQLVDPTKDLDAFHPLNNGLMIKTKTTPFFNACTPSGIVQLLKYYKIDISGKNVVVIGRSDIVGKPMLHMMLNLDASLEIADIVVVAVGKANWLDDEHMKSGVVVIDVGINYLEDRTKKSGYRIVGDVNIEKIKSSDLNKIAHYSPVPGGVGPLTVACLMQNCVTAAKAQYQIKE